MCGTGNGMSIAANKVKGIRAAKVTTNDEARLAREHNNANIICLSYKANMQSLKEMIEIFINTPFSNVERHVRRVQKISEMENNGH
jgi:ribose 5-phosphate isomerase B